MQISDAKCTVMNLVWDSQPSDARWAVETLADENGWSAATVETMLHRLVKKGALSPDQGGKRYQYPASVRRASRSFIDRVIQGETSPSLLHLVDGAKLSSDEVDQLRALLDNKAQGNV
jgi:BlaI family penicillinase repressor